MKSTSTESKITSRRMLQAMFTSLCVAVGALTLWFIVCLVSYNLNRALELVLRQATWLVPASIICAFPVVLSLPVKKKSEAE